MSICTQALQKCSETFGFDLNESQNAKFERYYELLVDWNTRMNLTAITEPEAVAVKHFCDSLLLLKAVDIPSGGRIADIGTGAGFPAIPVGIARPDVSLLLVDSLQKRVGFLQAVCEELSLNADCVHARAEEYAHVSSDRESCDATCARAVAELRVLCEYCIPFVKIGGVFAALKGPEIEDEIEAAMPAIRELGGEFVEQKQFTLPDGAKRSIVVIQKISQSPTKYPRSQAKILKSPLK